jgi:hypothetical protein
LELRFDAIKELSENLTEFGTRANLPLTVAEHSSKAGEQQASDSHPKEWIGIRRE